MQFAVGHALCAACSGHALVDVWKDTNVGAGVFYNYEEISKRNEKNCVKRDSSDGNNQSIGNGLSAQSEPMVDVSVGVVVGIGNDLKSSSNSVQVEFSQMDAHTVACTKVLDEILKVILPHGSKSHRYRSVTKLKTHSFPKLHIIYKYIS